MKQTGWIRFKRTDGLFGAKFFDEKGRQLYQHPGGCKTKVELERDVRDLLVKGAHILGMQGIRDEVQG